MWRQHCAACLARRGAPDIVELMSDLLAYKGALVGIWLAGLFLAERFWPAAPLPADLIVPLATFGSTDGVTVVGREDVD